MKAVYLPAIVPGLESLRRWEGLPTGWVDPRLAPTDPAYYPYLLLSYYYWERKTFTPPNDVFVFGDSGGYTVATLGASVDPRDVLRWQLRNCTVGVALDIPPWSSWADREAVCAQTATNVRLALPLYQQAREEGHPFRWWGVLHGRMWEEMERWYSVVSREYPFTEDGEGWAFKAWPTNKPASLARMLGFLRKKNVLRAHALMNTGSDMMHTLCVLGQLTSLQWLSFDSASATIYAANRYVMKLSTDGLVIETFMERERTGVFPGTQYMMEVCACASCALMRREFPEGPPRKGGYLFQRILFHNVLHFRELSENIARYSEQTELAGLRSVLGAVEYSETMRAYETGLGLQTLRGTPRSLLEWV